MIRTFKTKKLLFSPVGFLNSVAKWLLGVHSPTGTIRIRNTANPSEDGGPSIDIDSHEVARAIDPYIRASYPKVGVKKLLGASMKWENGQLEVDDNWLKARVIDNDSVDPSVGADMPQDVAGEADKGTLDKCARADHVHKLDTDSSLSFTNGKLGVNFGTAEGTAAEGNHDHDGEYADVDHTHDEYATSSELAEVSSTASSAQSDASTALSTANSASSLATQAASVAASAASAVSQKADKTHAHASSDITGLGTAATKNVGESGGVMAYDAKINTLSAALTNDGKVKTSSLTCDVSGHQNNCLLVATGAVVTHSGNAMYNLLAAATDQDVKKATKIITDKDAPYIPGASGSRIVKTADSGGQLVESEDVCATFPSDPAGSKLVQTSGTSGNLAEVTIGNGLKLENSTLSPKFNTSGGLEADSDGLKLSSVGSVSKTLQLITVENETSTNIVLSFYGLEIDKNGRVIGRSANPYKRIDVSPGF